ncbi:MAG TPA: hypothetical protein DCM87_16955 [Planctomycetes bacterium]|jgi:hypothetical protein|nr:hypothetical protein [Planctomycetota bacterium]
MQNDQAMRPEGLEARLQALTQSLTTEYRRTERKRRTFLAVGATLMVMCLVGLWTLTSMAFQLDAEALASIGRYKFERELPAGRAHLRDYLVEKAPELTSYAIGGLMSCVPSVRPYVLRELDAQFALLAKDYETQLTRLLEDSFAYCRAELNSRYPNLSDVERVDILVGMVAEQFSRNVEEFYHAIYPDFAAQIAQVEEYLVGLKTTDAAMLTPREQAEKEMIQTLLTLIAKEQGAQ